MLFCPGGRKSLLLAATETGPETWEILTNWKGFQVAMLGSRSWGSVRSVAMLLVGMTGFARGWTLEVECKDKSVASRQVTSFRGLVLPAVYRQGESQSMSWYRMTCTDRLCRTNGFLWGQKVNAMIQRIELPSWRRRSTFRIPRTLKWWLWLASRSFNLTWNAVIGLQFTSTLPQSWRLATRAYSEVEGNVL